MPYLKNIINLYVLVAYWIFTDNGYTLPAHYRQPFYKYIILGIMSIDILSTNIDNYTLLCITCQTLFLFSYKKFIDNNLQYFIYKIKKVKKNFYVLQELEKKLEKWTPFQR